MHDKLVIFEFKPRVTRRRLEAHTVTVRLWGPGLIVLIIDGQPRAVNFNRCRVLGVASHTVYTKAIIFA